MDADPQDRDTTPNNAAQEEGGTEDVTPRDLKATKSKVKDEEEVDAEVEAAAELREDKEAVKEEDEGHGEDDEEEEEEVKPRRSQRPKRKAAQKNVIVVKKAKKEGEEKGKKSGSSGFSKPVRVSEELAVFLGQEEISRPELTKFMWAYFKENGLQDPADRRVILADEKLKGLLKVERFNAFGFMKLVKPHLIG